MLLYFLIFCRTAFALIGKGDSWKNLVEGRALDSWRFVCALPRAPDTQKTAQSNADDEDEDEDENHSEATMRMMVMGRPTFLTASIAPKAAADVAYKTLEWRHLPPVSQSN